MPPRYTVEIHSETTSDLDVALEAARRLEVALARLLGTDIQPPEAGETFRAAEVAYAAGQPSRARELLDAALAERPDPELRALIHQLHGWLDVWSGMPLHAYERLLTEAEGLGAAHAGLAAELLGDAGIAAAIGGDPERARAAARRARELAVGSGSAAKTDLRAGITLLLAQDATAGEELIRRSIGEVGSEELARGMFRTDVVALYWMEEYGAAAAVLDELIERGRRSHDPLLPGWLDTRAAIDFRLGRWSAASARSSEARRLAEAVGHKMQTASCLSDAGADRGRPRPHGRVPSPHRAGSGPLRPRRGHPLRLGAGRGRSARARSRSHRRRDSSARALVSSSIGQATTDPSIAQGTPDLIEAYVRAGRGSDARRLCDGFEARASDSGRSWAAAALHRCRGLLAPLDEMDAEFAESLRRHRMTPTPFDLARTELCYGERLRRARRRRDARTYLRSALGTFAQLGAEPWAERARRELAATGGRAHSARGLRARLTPHELRVAALVERGLRNREIAAALFVSERTVEYHLTNIYGKLDIRSRTELMRVLAPASERQPA